ncbi:MAG: helix-turn-helix domain-containing protein [bacterium]|nr:helix-turn-helix domain-containing protein [bacterium]MBU1918627.1 helix-turn-helix domain-containing protein [bacterium]
MDITIDNKTAQTLASVVRFHRKKSGLSQSQLAKLAGIGKTTVFDIEKQKPTVRLNNLLAVLSVLNIRINLESPLMSFFEKEEFK